MSGLCYTVYDVFHCCICFFRIRMLVFRTAFFSCVAKTSPAKPLGIRHVFLLARRRLIGECAGRGFCSRTSCKPPPGTQRLSYPYFFRVRIARLHPLSKSFRFVWRGERGHSHLRARPAFYRCPASFESRRARRAHLYPLFFPCLCRPG